jgi:hypothetical protein
MLQLAEEAELIEVREDTLELPRYWNKWLSVTKFVVYIYTHTHTHTSKPVLSEYRHKQLPNLSVCNVQPTVATGMARLRVLRCLCCSAGFSE